MHLGRYLGIDRNLAILGSNPVKEGTRGATLVRTSLVPAGAFTVTSASRGSIIFTLIPRGGGKATRNPDKGVTSSFMQVFGRTMAATTPPAALPHELMLLS